MSEFPFASAVWADSAMRDSATTHSQVVQTSRLHVGRNAARFSVSGPDLHRYCAPGPTFPRGPAAARLFAALARLSEVPS